MQQEIIDNYEQYYPNKQSTSAEKSIMEFNPPENYDERFDHFIHFFNAIRTNGSVAEDATYGFRAAAPAVLTNTSYLKKKQMRWDPEKLVLRA